MQEKRDVRSALAASFRELVLEKPVEKITIKEITDRTGVIRVTFYNHFQDKYEVLEWICRQELLLPARALLENRMETEAVTFLFTALANHREFYLHAAKLEGQNSFARILKEGIASLVEAYTQTYGREGSGKFAWLTPARSAGYIAQSLTYIILEWIADGMKEPPAQMAQIYLYLSGWQQRTADGGKKE